MVYSLPYSFDCQKATLKLKPVSVFDCFNSIANSTILRPSITPVEVLLHFESIQNDPKQPLQIIYLVPIKQFYQGPFSIRYKNVLTYFYEADSGQMRITLANSFGQHIKQRFKIATILIKRHYLFLDFMFQLIRQHGPGKCTILFHNFLLRGLWIRPT